MATIRTEKLASGLLLAVEEQENPGAAMQLLVPVGAVHDPEGYEGASAVLEHWLWKGAGGLDARAYAEALDDLGVRRASHTAHEFTTISAAFLPEVLPRVLELIALLVKSPNLKDDTFEPARKAVEEAVLGLADDPPKKLFTNLRREVFVSPHGRNVEGSLESLKRLTPELVRRHYQDRYTLKGAILAVAGGVRFEEVKRAAEAAFSPLPGRAEEVPVRTSEPHLARWKEPGAQVQLGFFYRDVPPGDPYYYHARLAVQVLSGGMASRLFTEVREKRGLVYTVYAAPGNHKNFGYLAAYAGTTPEKAEKTREVVKEVIAGLSQGVNEDELIRAKVRTKSALVMHTESAQARAASMAKDLFYWGRVRPVEEVLAAVEAITLNDLNAFLKKHPYQDPWEGILGPEGGEA